MVSRDPRRLVRLGGLGLVPGARLRLQQETPAVVVAIGETTVALDPEIADEVYVRR
jgi:DtxR family Mn-dependent transcriptional regulator